MKRKELQDAVKNLLCGSRYITKKTVDSFSGNYIKYFQPHSNHHL